MKNLHPKQLYISSLIFNLNFSSDNYSNNKDKLLFIMQ